MAEALEARCPHCGASVAIEVAGGAMVACHECHQVFAADSATTVRPPSGTLQYFGETPTPEAAAFTSRPALLAMEFVATAVALGIAAGLMEPGPILRRLAGCGVIFGGLVGAMAGSIALGKKPLSYVDKSLAITSIAMGLLCMVAGLAILEGWRV